MAHVFTTYFAALPEEADAAFRLYCERTASVGILATSPRAHPATDDFHLWQLRCEAAYERIPHHDRLQLYVARSLVDGSVDPAQEDTTAAFYLDEENEPGHYPSVLEVSPNLTLNRDPHDLLLVEPIYLADPDTVDEAKRLYAGLQEAAVAYDPDLKPVDVIRDANKVGPLWVRSAANQGGGHCEECTSLHMDAWQGLILADTPMTPAEDVERGIYARLETTPF